jgi:hypothetical protein
MPASAAQIFGPTTVDPGFTTTGEKTLLTINTTLPTGGKNVIIATMALPSGFVSPGRFRLRIKKGGTILYETVADYGGGGGCNNPYTIFAVDTAPAGNDSYTFTINIITTATTTASVHTQAIVIKSDDAVIASNTATVTVANGATVDILSLATTFTLGSKVVVIATVSANTSTSTATRYQTTAGKPSLVRDTTVVTANEYFIRVAYPFGSGGENIIVLPWFETLAAANPTYKIRIVNDSGTDLAAFGQIVAFTVSDGAYLDGASTALSNGVQVTVGSLTTTLSGDVVVMGAGAYNYPGGTAGIFNAEDVVLQLNNSATGQVSNAVALQGSDIPRAAHLPLFRLDTAVSSPSYQLKMTSRTTAAVNGEAKILAFTISVIVTVGDSGVGVDSVSVLANMPVLDAGTGVEVADLTGSIPASDTGSGVEITDLSVVVPVDDVGTGVEFITSGVFQSVDDTGSGIDGVLMLLKEVLDTSVGTELVDMVKGILDVGTGIEIINSPQFNQLFESGLGVDTPMIVVPQFDAGIGVDMIDMLKEVLDMGVGVEEILFLSKEILDTSSGFDVISLVTNVISHDFGVGTDVVGLVSVVQVVDTGVGVDLGETQLSIYGVVTLDNSVIVGVHSIPYRDLARDGLPIQTQRRFVDDRVYVGGVEVGVVTVEWEDKVADIMSGVRTVRVAGVVRLVE